MIRLVGLVLVASLALGGTALAGDKKPKARKASVEDVAGVVVQNKPEIEEAIADLDFNCGPTYCDVDLALTLTHRAEVLSVSLDEIDDRTPKSNSYLGTIPKKVRRIHRSTIKAANETAEASREFTECANDLPDSASSMHLVDGSTANTFDTAAG